jgi:hypothetical protein
MEDGVILRRKEMRVGVKSGKGREGDKNGKGWTAREELEKMEEGEEGWEGMGREGRMGRDRMGGGQRMGAVGEGILTWCIAAD